MKKFYLMMAAACVFGAANAKTLEVNFDGTDHEGWTQGDGYTYANGHVTAVMTGDPKKRADFRYDATGNDVLALNPSTDKVLAVKFIGSRPHGNITMELRFADNVTCNTKWKNRPDGTTLTKAGNQICYFKLDKDDVYGTQTTNDLKFLNFKIADCEQAPYEWTIDWIKTYPSVEALEADKNRLDDGASDYDEDIVQNMPVVNETTKTGYTSFIEAWNMAANGDVITIKEDQTITSTRLNANGRKLTINAENGAKLIRDEKNNKTILFLANDGDVVVDGETVHQNCDITLNNVTIDGQNVECSVVFIEASKGTVTLKNVLFDNCKTTNNQGIISIKNSGKVIAYSTYFTNCTVPEGRGEIFCGTNGLTVYGDSWATIYVEKKLTFSAADIQGSGVMTVFVDANRDMDENALVVKGSDLNPANFKSGINNYTLEAVDGGIGFASQPGYVCGIEAVAAESDDAPVEYYNLQGVRVMEPSNGLYIRRQGTKVTKVIVK